LDVVSGTSIRKGGVGYEDDYSNNYNKYSNSHTYKNKVRHVLQSQEGQSHEGWLLYASEPNQILVRGRFILNATHLMLQNPNNPGNAGNASNLGNPGNVVTVVNMKQDVVSVTTSVLKDRERRKFQKGNRSNYNPIRRINIQLRNGSVVTLWSEDNVDGSKWYTSLASHALDFKIAHYVDADNFKNKNMKKEKRKTLGNGNGNNEVGMPQEQRSPQRQVADLRRGAFATLSSGTKEYWIQIGRLYHAMMSSTSNLDGVSSYRRFHPDASLNKIPVLNEVINLTVMTWRSGAPYFVSVVETMVHLQTMMLRKELYVHTENWKTTFLSLLDVTQSLRTNGLPLDRVDELWMSCGISSTEMDCRLLWCDDVRQWLNEYNKDGVGVKVYEDMLWSIQNA